MKVISDAEISKQNESKKIITERIEQNQLLCVLLENKIIGFIGWDVKFQNNSEFWYLEQITIQKDYRGKGIDVAMGVKMLQSAWKRGMDYIDSHLELETNTKMRMEMEKMGGFVYKRYRIFQKKL